MTEPIHTPVEAWWRDTTETDLQLFLPKLREYGTNDLIAIGRDLAMLTGWDNCPERVMGEMGCAFYLRGKNARAMEAYAHHRLPSDDTYRDQTAYSMMVRRYRAVGSLI